MSGLMNYFKNRKYAVHPKDFEIGETEKFYSDMAAKGWALTKRGVSLSRFEKAQPQKMRYRIEVISAKALEDVAMPEEQLAVYEDCGWEYVDGRNFIHVFRAPEGSEAPEFYMEPAQQAETLKGLKRHYMTSVLNTPMYLTAVLLMGFLVDGFANGKWLAQTYRAFVEQTAVVMIFVLLLIWTLAGSIRAAWRMQRLCKKLKKGIPLDHAPKTKRLISKIGNGLAVLLLFGLIIYGIWGYEKLPLPQESDEPYLLLSELGIEGERVTNWVNQNESSLIRNTSWIAHHWDTGEYVDTETSEEWMYQEVYKLSNPKMMDSFVDALMKDATFGKSREDFTEIEIEGLDRAWLTHQLECIAVKDDLVAALTYPFDSEKEVKEVLQILANKWEKIQ